MPIKFTLRKRCKSDDCRAFQPRDRIGQHRYEAPTTCYTCHKWHDEFITIVESVKVRTGFRWNGGYENPNAFD